MMDIHSLGTQISAVPWSHGGCATPAKGQFQALSLNFFPIFYFFSHPDGVSAEGTPVLHSAIPYPALADKQVTF